MLTSKQASLMVRPVGPYDEFADIMGIKFEDAAGWNAGKLAVMRMWCADKRGVRDHETLKQRILECVHAFSLSSMPITLRGLNRRFGWAVRQAGSCAKDVCSDLIKEEKLHVLQDHPLTFLSMAMWEEQVRLGKESGTTVMQLTEQLISQTVK